MPKTPAIDHAVIRELAKLLDETGLTEIEFQRDGVSIRVARNVHVSARGRAAELPIGGAAATALVAPVQATPPSRRMVISMVSPYGSVTSQAGRIPGPAAQPPR